MDSTKTKAIFLKNTEKGWTWLRIATFLGDLRMQTIGFALIESTLDEKFQMEVNSYDFIEVEYVDKDGVLVKQTRVRILS